MSGLFPTHFSPVFSRSKPAPYWTPPGASGDTKKSGAASVRIVAPLELFSLVRAASLLRPHRSRHLLSAAFVDQVPVGLGSARTLPV